MRRYSLTSDGSGAPYGYYLAPDDEGAWVRREDAQRVIHELHETINYLHRSYGREIEALLLGMKDERDER